MALSVSGFPEPLRQNPADTDAEPSLLANNPMLRGLFGKKAESKPLSRQNTEESIPSSPSPSSSTPRTSQMLASADEQAFLAQIALQNPEPLPPMPHQRQRQVSLTRRTPPPVKRQPSLGRLEIGSAPRGAPGGPPLHTLPKPPTVVVQEWKTQEPTLAHPRPLPAVPTPGPIIESSKTAAMRAAVAHRPPASKVIMTGPMRPRAQTTAPHAVSVRYQSMAVDPRETEGASSSSSSGAATSSLPSSTGGSTSAIPNTINNTTNTTTSATLTQNQSQVRPLPRIPPASAVQPSHHRLPPHVPRPTRVKRPKTSPSSSAGFGSAVRSPFDAVPSSWASRPVDLNPSQPVASTSTAGPSTHAFTSQASISSPSASHQVPRALPLPRPRSQSRPRRERSVEPLGSGSRSAATSPVRRTPPDRFPAISSTPGTPTLDGMSISPSSVRRTPTRASGSGSGYGSSSPTTSPRLGHPSPNRFLTDRGTPSTAKIDEESASIRSQALDFGEAIGGGRPSTADSRPSHEHPSMSDIEIDADADADSGEPLGPFIDDLDHTSLLSRSPSPMRYARPSSRGSLSFSDDDYFSDTRSRSRSHRPGRGKQLRAFRHSYRAPPRNPERSPSPIAYARRRSLEVDVDVEMELLAGEGGEGEATPVDRKPPRRHTQPRSYQFDYAAAQETSPFLWNAGANADAGLADEGITTVKGGKEGKNGKEGKDGKEKEKQKEKERKKAEKEARKSAGSVKSKRSKSKGSSRTNSHTNSLTHSIPSSGRPSRSRSPRGRRSVMGTPTGSVIDISSPTTLAGSYHELTLEKEKMLSRKDSKRGSRDKDKELRRLRTHNHKHKERTHTSFSGMLPDVAMWGVGVKEKETGKEKEKEGAPSNVNVKGKAGGGWKELVPLRRGSEPEWVGVGGQLYESEKANAMVVAAIQRG